MLYDKRWEKPEVKANPFSLENLIAWLEKQPADKRYDYTECHECLLSQYFKDMGFDQVSLSPDFLSHADGCVPLPPHFDDIAIQPHVRATPNPIGWTFGAALERARKAISSKEL